MGNGRGGQISVLAWSGLLLLLLFWLSSSTLYAQAQPQGQSQNQPTETTSPSPNPHDLLNRPGPLWLVGVDWQGENLNGAHLIGANLSQAQLQGAFLNGADMTNANLLMAALQGSQMVQARLDGADLAVANLVRARLTMASLLGAKLESATLVESNLSGAKLDKANLSNSNLRRAVFHGATLRDANLRVADLRGADLRGADLTGADLTNANLEEANLHEAQLANITYDEQTLWPKGFDPALAVYSSTVPAPREPLKIEINLVPGFTQQFNQLAQPQDIAHIDYIGDMAQLQDLHVGQRMAVFKSAELAEQLLPRSAAYLDMIGYNLEHGPTNPLAEQSEPIASVQRMRAVADRFGLPLAIGPDHDFVVSDGVKMAPYADQFILQVQRVQDQPQLVEEYVISTANALRQANPAVEVLVQVRTDGDLDALVQMLKVLEPHIDGVAILTSPQTTEFATTLWARLRPSEGLPPPAANTITREEFPVSNFLILIEGLVIQLILVALIGAVFYFLPKAM